MAVWLDLVPGSTGWSLIDTGRLDDIVQGMSHPASQYPSLVYFAGNNKRLVALQSLFPQNNITRRGPAGLARLHLSTTTANTEYPIVFADTSLHGQPALGDSILHRSLPRKCRHYSLQWNVTQSLMGLQRQLIAQLILPWTQVLCLFADGESELLAARALLDTPRRTVGSGGIHVDINTLKVVVILTNPGAHYDPELLHDACHSARQYAPITVLDLRGRHSLSPKAAYEPLRRLLLNELAVDRSERKAHGLLFSASHLQFLWGRTLRDGLLTLPTATIDCLRIAREQLPVRGQWKDGLAELLKRACKVDCSDDDIHQFVASALLMDAYPPEMHRESLRPPYKHLSS